jgi:hypothetical protein
VIDPETREQWQGVADAWHSAAEAAATTPPLIWGWERERWRGDYCELLTVSGKLSIVLCLSPSHISVAA